ncbi:MAG: hypothetical protein IPM29_12160 [Planctomycetes bacterium]|nr:hypothetical protein [Planctomycetota bacterium]
MVTAGGRDANDPRGLAALLSEIAAATADSAAQGTDDERADGVPGLAAIAADEGLRPRTGHPPTVALELLIGFGVVVGFELATCGGSLGGAGMVYHPYWLVVLPVAVARGLGSGVAAAGIACALLIAGAILRGEADVPAEALQLDVMRHGIAFLLAAFVLGWIRDEVRARHAALWRRHVELAGAHEVTARIEERLLDSNRRLKLRLLDQTAQFGSLIDAARQLRSASDEDAALDMLLRMVEEQCGAARCSVLHVGADGTLTVAASRGWAVGSERQHVDAAERSWVVSRAASGGGRCVDCFGPGALPPGDGPLAAAPLSIARGRVSALLCIDALPAHRFTTATTSLLAAIADWSAHAGGRDSAMASSVAVDERLGSHLDLAARLKGEVGRAALIGERASVVAVRLQGGRAAEREAAAILLSALLHASDGLYETGLPGCLAIVMPVTPIHAARQAARRFASRLHGARPQHVSAADFIAVELPANAYDVADALGALAAALGTELPAELGQAAGYARDREAFVRDLRAEADLATRVRGEVWVAFLRTEPAFAEALDDALAVAAAALEPPAVAYRLGDGRAVVMMPAVVGDEAFAVATALEHEVRARGADPDRTVAEVFAFGAEDQHTFDLLDRLLDPTELVPAGANRSGRVPGAEAPR